MYQVETEQLITNLLARSNNLIRPSKVQAAIGKLNDELFLKKCRVLNYESHDLFDVKNGGEEEYRNVLYKDTPFRRKTIIEVAYYGS